MHIDRYVLLDRDNNEQDYEYDSYDLAVNDATERGWAVIERHYEYADSELVWTPNGGDTWPPKARR